MLSCDEADRLRTGMWGPFGKSRAQWTLVESSWRLYPAVEQGACDWGPRQGQVQVSWLPEDPHFQVGFTKFNMDTFEDRKVEKQLILDGLWGQIRPWSWPVRQMAGFVLMKASPLLSSFMTPNKFYFLSKKNPNNFTDKVQVLSQLNPINQLKKALYHSYTNFQKSRS